MLTLKVNNFPTWFEPGLLQEPLFLNPNGNRTRYPIGWLGKGRYKPGSLRIWNENVPLLPGVDYTEEPNGIFFNFDTPPAIGNCRDYLVGYIPREADLLIADDPDDEMFLFPNWLGATWIGDAFWIARHQASKSDATDASAGGTTVPTSRKGVVPWANLDYNAAYAAATGKGTGWHLVRNREWTNIALWCEHHGIYPTGNSASGFDGMGNGHAADPIVAGRALTSTGPVTSSHNLLPGGICDLVGNIWEWIDGLQLVGNTIYVADEDGTMTSTGLTGGFGTSGNAYNYLREDIPLELFPASAAGKPWLGKDGYWYSTSGTMQASRGGGWTYGALCGLGALSLDHARTNSYTVIGFRLALTLGL